MDSYEIRENGIENLPAPAIAIIGGGTGNATLLGGLKNLTDNISAIVNMCDDGSSTGFYRKENNASAVGDLRQCLSALSNDPIVSNMFESREDGHPIGNRALVNLEMQTGDINQAIAITSKMLDITGQVIPVTTQKPELAMRDGEETFRGESAIGKKQFTEQRPRIWLEPEASINPYAEEALYEAGVIVIAPGNLYRSLLPALAVRGINETFHYTKAQKVVVANILNSPGQTVGWHVADYIKEIERYTGQNSIDTVIYNTSLPDKEFLEEMGESSAEYVDIEQEKFLYIQARAIGAEVMSRTIAKPATNDILYEGSRSRIRHDAAKVARQLIELAKPF